MQQDLRQGGVGDCWFMSALAVVAERPDLVLRLFGDTARNQAGCYQVNLFLDGEWRAITIDDRLPCTHQQRRPDGSGLAFSRFSSETRWSTHTSKQVWLPVVASWQYVIELVAVQANAHL
eukprot:s243_g19.t1